MARICLLFMALLAGSAAVAQSTKLGPLPIISTADRPSPDDFAETSWMSTPILSPDGSKVALTRQRDDQTQIAIFDVGEWDVPSRILPVGGEETVRSLRWAGNDRLIIGILMFQKVAGMRLPATRLVVFTPATGQKLPIGRSAGIIGDNIIYAEPAGRFILLSTQKSLFDAPSVDRIDLATGAAQLVQKSRPGVLSWFSDNSGIVRAGIEYDGGRWRVLYRASGDSDWKRMRLSKGSDDDSIVETIRFATAVNRGAMVTNARTGRFAVYEYDFANETVGQPIFEHPTADIDTLIMSKDGKGIDGITYEDDRPRVHWLNPAYADVQARIDKALPRQTNRILDSSEDGNRILIWSASANDPGAYYLYDRPSRRMELFANPYKRVGPEALSPVRRIDYAARDGLQLKAYLTVPRGGSGKAGPMIVMPHGGPFARDHAVYDPIVQFMASRGYTIVQPQFRGSTGQGRRLVEAGYGQWGVRMQDDLDDAVDWAIKSGIADPKRICIVGASYGGYAAMWGAIRNPERYRCAVSIAGISDVRAMLKQDSRIARAERYAPKWKSMVAGEEKRDLAAISPLQQAMRLGVPLMVVHGEKDSNVPPEQSKKFVKALQELGKPVEAVYYPDSGHGLTTSSDLADFFKRLEAFLAKHNPA